jgi:hypothetical protein
VSRWRPEPGNNISTVSIQQQRSVSVGIFGVIHHNGAIVNFCTRQELGYVGRAFGRAYDPTEMLAAFIPTEPVLFAVRLCRAV